MTDGSFFSWTLLHDGAEGHKSIFIDEKIAVTYKRNKILLNWKKTGKGGKNTSAISNHFITRSLGSGKVTHLSFLV